MSTTSPVTSFEAAASLPCSCSCAIANGADARAAMKVAVTATLKTVDLLLLELNIREMSAARRAGQRARRDKQNVRFGALGDRALSLFLDQIRELIKKVRCIMGAGSSFGMILHTEDRQFFVPHSLHSAVV